MSWILRYIPIVNWLVADKCVDTPVEVIPAPLFKFKVSSIQSLKLPFTTSFRIGIDEKGWTFPEGTCEFTSLINSNGYKFDPNFYYIIRLFSVTQYNNTTNVPITIHFKPMIINDKGEILVLNDTKTKDPLKYTLLPETSTSVSDGTIIPSKFDRDGFYEIFGPLRNELLSFNPFHDTENKWVYIPIDHPFYKILIVYLDSHREYLKSNKIDLFIHPEYNDHGEVLQVRINVIAFEKIKEFLKTTIFDNIDVISIQNSIFGIERSSLPELSKELRQKFEKLVKEKNTYNPENQTMELSISLSIFAEVIRYPISDTTQSTVQSFSMFTNPQEVIRSIDPYNIKIKNISNVIKSKPSNGNQDLLNVLFNP